MEIKKVITIAQYAATVQATLAELITNGPKGNWLSFKDATGKQVSTLPVGGSSQDCESIPEFSVLQFSDGGQVATANTYVVADTLTFD
tara:strand:+ start:80 stop:343 length:264 start_codon:yes stop_codon:yes gene_type:complete